MSKIRKLLCGIFLFLCCFGNVSAKEFEIHSKHAILYNLNDNTILYEKDSTEKTAVASLTKIMTTIVAIEKIDNLNKKVTLTKDVFNGLREANASVAGFKIGDKVTYMDLLMGIMLPSGADAARGIAINLAGSEKEFVVYMNQKAQELGLTNTHFVNITGLDTQNHYSTVKDIATLLQYALKNPTFYKIYTTKEYTTTNGKKLYSTLRKLKNQTSLDVSNILGTKTGYTGDAGLCLSSIANYNDVNYLLVTTGANPNTNSPLQLLDALTIYNYYANNYDYYNIVNTNDVLATIPIQYSSKSQYNITIDQTVSKYLPNTFDKEKITYIYDGVKSLSYKNKQNEKIGTIKIIYEDEILDTINIYLEDKINFSIFYFLTQTKLIYPVILILIIFAYSIYKILFQKKLKISL